MLKDHTMYTFFTGLKQPSQNHYENFFPKEQDNAQNNVRIPINTLLSPITLFENSLPVKNRGKQTRGKL